MKNTWFEVYRITEYGTESVATFDTNQECLDFICNRQLLSTKETLAYDEWEKDANELPKRKY